MGHNKFGRRYKRHREKHLAYFEALAREVIDRGNVHVDIGPRLEVRYSRRKRLLEFVESDGSVSRLSNMAVYKRKDRVSVIADYLMMWAADRSGVQIPLDGLDPRTRDG